MRRVDKTLSDLRNKECEILQLKLAGRISDDLYDSQFFEIMKKKEQLNEEKLLFYGKSGTGKTETAKYISKVLDEPIFRKQFSMYQNTQFATYLFGGTHHESKALLAYCDQKIFDYKESLL